MKNCASVIPNASQMHCSVSIFGGVPLVSIALSNIGNGFDEIMKASLFSVPGLVLLASEFVLESWIVRVIEVVMKGQRKALAAKLRKGELEHVNQEE